jgi:hypothetical protein
MRGRMAKVASLWSGSPLSSIVIVTTAALHGCWPLQLVSGATLATLPTLMPAMRTSESGRTPLALANTALTVYGLANGLANLVKPR